MASVGVLIYHTSKDAFLLVRQFRPPLYATKCRDAAELAAPPPGKEAGAPRARWGRRRVQASRVAAAVDSVVRAGSPHVAPERGQPRSCLF